MLQRGDYFNLISNNANLRCLNFIGYIQPFSNYRYFGCLNIDWYIQPFHKPEIPGLWIHPVII